MSNINQHARVTIQVGASEKLHELIDWAINHNRFFSIETGQCVWVFCFDALLNDDIDELRSRYGV